MPAAAGSRPRPRDMGAARNSAGVLVRETMLPPGAGILAGSGTLYKSSVTRVGDIITTQIAIDLTGLASSTTDADIIGTAGVCHIGQITAAVNGTIFGGAMKCWEVPATGADDIDLFAATEATGAYDALITGLVETIVVDSNSAWANGEELPIVADSIAANKYLYLVNGESGTAGTYTAGRFIITLHGYAV